MILDCEIVREDILKNSIIVDVDINYKDGKLVGNVNYDRVDKSNYITKVPGGIGLITTAVFIENILNCYYLNNEILD